MTSSTTERERASFGPRDMKDKGSVEYAWQTLNRLKTVWTNVTWTKERWEEILREAEDARVWELVPPGKPYGSKRAMLEAELGMTVDELRAAVIERAENLKERRGVGQNLNHDNSNDLAEAQGNNADYLTARIARDHPDILADMRAGKYRSVRAAAIDAGIIDPDKSRRYQVPADDPVKAARYLAERCDDGWIATLVAELLRHVTEE